MEAVSTDPRVPDAEEFRRVERKFLIDEPKLEFIRRWLAHATVADHEFPSGTVTSIYYDNRDFDSYFASIDGDLEKRKVRLRWYDALPPTGQARAFLEVKDKDGFETWKRRVAVTIDGEAVAARRFEEALPADQMTSQLASLGVFDAGTLEPAVVISYARSRFRDHGGSATLSLDSQLMAIPARSVGPSVGRPIGTNVLELKSREMGIPVGLTALARFAPVWTSHSKYALAIDLVAASGAVNL